LDKIRILYAEGYDIVLSTAKRLFEAEGWEVDVCRDGAAALKKLEGSEHFDLLVLDDRLGGASGRELIERARSSGRLRAAPIILFAAGREDGEPHAPGADLYLAKPGGLKDLIPACRRLLPQAEAREDGGPQSAESKDQVAGPNYAGE
jgi:CheY-like chemotaxis protein